jgi:hypothetical protein
MHPFPCVPGELAFQTFCGRKPHSTDEAARKAEPRLVFSGFLQGLSSRAPILQSAAALQ